jgi:hypothetical protein
MMPSTLIHPANLTDPLSEIFIPMVFRDPDPGDYILACLFAPWEFDIIFAHVRTLDGSAGVTVWINDSTKVTWTGGVLISADEIQADQGPARESRADPIYRVGVGDNVKVEMSSELTSDISDLQVQLKIRHVKDR